MRINEKKQRDGLVCVVVEEEREKRRRQLKMRGAGETLLRDVSLLDVSLCSHLRKRDMATAPLTSSCDFFSLGTSVSTLALCCVLNKILRQQRKTAKDEQVKES